MYWSSLVSLQEVTLIARVLYVAIRLHPTDSQVFPYNPYSSFVFYSTLRLQSILPWEFLVNHEVQSDINRTTRATSSLIRMRLRGSSNRSVLTTFHSMVLYSSFSRRNSTSSVAQRTIIEFLAVESTILTGILHGSRLQFGDGTLWRARVFAWRKLFFSGRRYVRNASRPRRPETSVTPVNIEANMGNWSSTIDT